MSVPQSLSEIRREIRFSGISENKGRTHKECFIHFDRTYDDAEREEQRYNYFTRQVWRLAVPSQHSDFRMQTNDCRLKTNPVIWSEGLLPASCGQRVLARVVVDKCSMVTTSARRQACRNECGIVSGCCCPRCLNVANVDLAWPTAFGIPAPLPSEAAHRALGTSEQRRPTSATPKPGW